MYSFGLEFVLKCIYPLARTKNCIACFAYFFAVCLYLSILNSGKALTITGDKEKNNPKTIAKVLTISIESQKNLAALLCKFRPENSKTSELKNARHIDKSVFNKPST